MRNQRAIPVPVPVTMNFKLAVIALAVAIAGLGVVVLVKSKRGTEPAAVVAKNQEEPMKENTAAPAPKKEGAPVAAAPAKKKPAGITFGTIAEGSAVDPAAPARPVSTYAAKKEAALKKWRETSIDIQRGETTLRDVLAEIEKSTGIKVGIDPGVTTESNLSVSMSGLCGEDALGFIADVAQLAWVIDGDGESWMVPEEKRDLYESPDARELRLMQSMSGTIDAEAATADGDPQEKVVNGMLDGTKISMSILDVTLNNAIGTLVMTYNVPLNLDRANIPDLDAKLSVEIKDSSAREALKTLLEPRGLDFVVTGGQVLISTKDAIQRKSLERAAVAETKARERKERAEQEQSLFDKTVAIDAKDLSIRDVAERISKALGVGYVIDTPTWSRAARYGFDGEPHTLREIFEALGKGAPVRVAYREGKLWYLSTQAAK